MNLGAMRDRLRMYIDDTKPQNYKWSNEELNACCNQALQEAFIRANLTVEDDIGIPFTQTLNVWDAKYVIPASIITVRAVRLASKPSIILPRTSFNYQGKTFNYRPATETGVYEYVLDQTTVNSLTGLPERSITVVGTPTVQDTLLLDVERLPNTLVSDTDIPEIDTFYHDDLIFGAAFYAFQKRDADTFDAGAMQRYNALFEERFGERLPAVVIRERQTDVPWEMIVQ